MRTYAADRECGRRASRSFRTSAQKRRRFSIGCPSTSPGRAIRYLGERGNAGLSRENLYRALSPDGNPEFATVVRVLQALHLKLAAVPAG
ncbi:MAG TPA: hypothetical protein VFT69_12865 [Pseudolabrys sp.]|nr:hypothetical protein [Pseudolabrys sp.]